MEDNYAKTERIKNNGKAEHYRHFVFNGGETRAYETFGIRDVAGVCADEDGLVRDSIRKNIKILKENADRTSTITDLS